jgi:NitT/TauT family transport system substrate-binding protein
MTIPLVIPAVTLVSLSCSSGDYAGEPQSVTFGAIPSGSAALVYIAQHQGSFQAEGLSMTVRDYSTGVETIDALLGEQVDIAWAAEFPMLARAFAGEEISIFAVSSRFSDQYLFGLKDRGIDEISDLKGRTIGVPLDTIAEFYLARYLELNGIIMQEVSPVNVPPTQSVEALIDGSVDGVVTWEPYTTSIREQLGDSIVAWSVQSNQPGFGVMIGRNDWLTEHPQLVQRFLKSLARAEDYLIDNPEGAKDIVQERLNYDDALMAACWSECQFGLSLEQALVVAMEDEGRWMIDNNLTAEKQIPDLLDYIYEDALKVVKPEAVNIVR